MRPLPPIGSIIAVAPSGRLLTISGYVGVRRGRKTVECAYGVWQGNMNVREHFVVLPEDDYTIVSKGGDAM